MTYKKINLVLVLVALSFTALAQKPMIYIKAIGGTYDMGAMKKFQESYVNYYLTNGQSAKVISEFPLSIQAEVGVDFEAKVLKFGPWINFTHAKGDLMYNDNTSNVTMTQDLQRFSAGFKVLKNLYKDLGIYSKLGVNASMLSIKSSGSSTSSNNGSYLSNGGSFELGCQWKYSFGKVKLITNFGYEAGVNETLGSRSGDSYELKNMNGEAIKVNWNGLRIGIGVGYSFAKKLKPFKPATIEVD